MSGKISDFIYIFIQGWFDGIIIFGIIFAIITGFTSIIFKENILKDEEEKKRKDREE